MYDNVVRIHEEKRVNIFGSECVGTKSAGRPRKRWMDAISECVVERKKYA